MLGNEYDWLDSDENPRRGMTARDVVSGWVVSAIAMVSIFVLFGF